NTLSDIYASGIVVANNTSQTLGLDSITEANRDDYHIFVILEKGSGLFEIDFKQYELNPNR
ncbi:MAG TPA: AraC family transcriptional regulator, partial [Sphingobacterium sp.]|nr:AraC family transcriptional regulator [Sphingobacterium sp.]